MKKLNVENFEKTIRKQKKLFIIKFSSPTCGPCQTMIPVVNALASQNKNIDFFEIDTMESPELASHFGVRGVPNIVYCEKREVIYRFVGITPLRDMQYVISNIDDLHFRETGEFKIEKEKNAYIFPLLLALIILVFVVFLVLI